MSLWGWKPEGSFGIWRYGAQWAKPFLVAAPWISILLLLLMFHMIGGTFTAAKGVLFDLPDSDMAEGEHAGIVALVMPMAHETLVFLDDARYLLGDDASRMSLGRHMSELVARADRKSVLVLADRRVSGGDLMKFAALARHAGVRRVLFAEKKTGGAVE